MFQFCRGRSYFLPDWGAWQGRFSHFSKIGIEGESACLHMPGTGTRLTFYHQLDAVLLGTTHMVSCVHCKWNSLLVRYGPTHEKKLLAGSGDNSTDVISSALTSLPQENFLHVQLINAS